jgi:hypothetical protein
MLDALVAFEHVADAVVAVVEGAVEEAEEVYGVENAGIEAEL